jgi:hypothetical protein
MKSKTSKEKHGKERTSRGNQQSMNNLGPEKQIKMQQRGNTERSLAGFSGFDFCFGFSIDLFSDLSSLYSSVFERGAVARGPVPALYPVQVPNLAAVLGML